MTVDPPPRRFAAAARALARVFASLSAVGLGLALALATALPAHAAPPPPTLKEMMGTYLGRAVVKDYPDGRTEEREIDVEMLPYRSNGFRIRWTNVTLVNGRRDLPGVKRRVSEAVFNREKDQPFFAEVVEGSVFAEREEATPVGGDPVRWALIDGAGLHIYTFVVLADGRYELQSYTRRRVGDALELRYERVVDGERVRTIEGRAVKAE